MPHNLCISLISWVVCLVLQDLIVVVLHEQRILHCSSNFIGKQDQMEVEEELTKHYNNLLIEVDMEISIMVLTIISASWQN